MKYDYYEIKCLEEEYNAVLLSRLQREQQYLYLKVRKRYPEKIFTIPITLQNGKKHGVKFVKNADLTELKQRKRSNNDLQKK